MKHRLSVLAIAIAAVLGVFATPDAARADELRIATQPIPHYAPIFVAKRKHWLEEELAKAGAPQIIWSSFAAGPPINESFAAGQQDIGFLGDTPALIGRAVGIDTRVIGITSTGPKTLGVIVAADSPIKTPADLKGKKVAVTKGSYAHHLLALVLQQGGLGFGDIEQINLPNSDIATTLIKGDIDAGAVWEPVLTRFRNQGTIRVLADGTGIKAGLLVIIATQDVIKARPEQVRALLRAYQRGADYIRSNPKEAAELITGDVNLAPELLQQVFANFDYAPPVNDGAVQEIKKSEAFMRGIGLIKVPVDVDTFVVRGLGPEVAVR